MIEDGQQFGLVGIQPRQQAIQSGEPSPAIEDAIEAIDQMTATTWRRIDAVRFQIGVVAPDQAADMLLDGMLLVCERIQLVDQSFRMDPTQSVLGDCLKLCVSDLVHAVIR